MYNKGVYKDIFPTHTIYMSILILHMNMMDTPTYLLTYIFEKFI